MKFIPRKMYFINFFYSFILLVVFAISSCVEQKPSHIFSFRSAKVLTVSYGKLFGTIRKTNTTIWVDSYGERMSVLSQSVNDYSNFGFDLSEEFKTLDIVRGDSVYSINLINNTGLVYSIRDYADSLCFERVAFCAYRKHLDGVNQGTGIFNGFCCEKISLFDIQLWFYKGFPLKRVSKSLGDIFTEEALSFEENCPVDSSKFVIPQNVIFQNKYNKCLTKNN